MPLPPFASGGGSSRPYKAVVVLFLAGGCDSFNLLVPHSGCSGSATALDQQYTDIRGDVALSKSQLNSIAVATGTQPCSTFGVHKKLQVLKSLYDDGDATFIANVGPLVEPLSKDEYEAKTKLRPPQLFAHNTQQRAVKSTHPQDIYAKGVLGRLVEALSTQASGYRAGIYSTAGSTKMVEGSTTPVDIVDPNSGVRRFEQLDGLGSDLDLLLAHESTSVFGETHLAAIRDALHRTEGLGAALEEGGTLLTQWPDGGLSKQLKQVATVMAARTELSAERDAFYVELGGFDSHNDVAETIDEKFAEMDEALSAFVAELKAQGVWDSVALLSVSDFGRTLTSNGRGTDHAWGGNNFLVGGGLAGGKILGEYPSDITEDSPLNIGRGRLIPTTSWEGVWYGLAQWLGVEEARLASVLPNLPNFPDARRFTQAQLFA